jgi:hypothetical protein
MTLTEHLTTATTAITGPTNPDGHEAVGALLLATHAATRIAAAAADRDSAAWDFCALSLADATTELRAGITDEVVLSPTVSATSADDWALTAHTLVLLINRLADLYADAAKGPAARRQQWQRVAGHLADAAADVP